MSQSLQTRLPLEDLATARRTLRGRADAGGLGARLAEALGCPDAVGRIDYELSFEPATGGTIAVRGVLHARLGAVCQRCLEPFRLPLELTVRVLLPLGSQPVVPEEGWDIAEVGERPTLSELITQELLLALPFLPRHPEGECPGPAPRLGAGDESPRQRPFAGLDKVLRGKDSTD